MCFNTIVYTTQVNSAFWLRLIDQLGGDYASPVLFTSEQLKRNKKAFEM